MTWPDRILRWIEPEDNPANTVYGTLAAGLVIAAEDPTTESYPRVLTATVVAVATYWLAHGYAHWVGQRFRRHARDPRRVREFAGALGHEWPLAEGAAVPLTALLASWAAGAPLTTGVPVAVWTAAAALVAFEAAAGVRRRLPAAQLLANAAIGLALGAALLAVKLVLH
jgi:hypothetical protein